MADWKQPAPGRASGAPSSDGAESEAKPVARDSQNSGKNQPSPVRAAGHPRIGEDAAPSGDPGSAGARPDIDPLKKPKPKARVKPRKRPVTSKTKALDESAAALENKYLRLRAEYDNYIRRTSSERDALIVYAGVEIYQALLPLIDDLKRTVETSGDKEQDKIDTLREGIQMVLNKFQKFLQAQGVAPYESVGKPFDPDLHEALMSRSSKKHPAGIVLEEYEAGYTYRDKIIRHSKVIVSG